MKITLPDELIKYFIEQQDTYIIDLDLEISGWLHVDACRERMPFKEYFLSLIRDTAELGGSDDPVHFSEIIAKIIKAVQVEIGKEQIK